MSHSNPINVRIGSDSNFQLSCVANGASYQRVTVSQNGKTIATFSGSGEGTQMKQTDGSTTLSGPAQKATQLSLLFQNSQNGPNGPFQNSMVTVDSTAGIVTTIAAQDSMDHARNDIVLTLVAGTLAAVGAAR